MSLVKQGSAQNSIPTVTSGKLEGEGPAELDFEQTWDRYIQSLEEMREHARQRQSKLTEMIDAAHRVRGRPKLLQP